MVDFNWAAHTVHELDASVLALSVQVANMALGAGAERDEGDEAQTVVKPSQLQVEVEAWREALVSASRCVAELIQIQRKWTALQVRVVPAV